MFKLIALAMQPNSHSSMQVLIHEINLHGAATHLECPEQLCFRANTGT